MPLGSLFGSSTQDVTTHSAPWEEIQPYLLGNPGTQGYWEGGTQQWVPGLGSTGYGVPDSQMEGGYGSYQQVGGTWVPGGDATPGILDDVMTQYQAGMTPNANQTTGHNMALNYADGFGDYYNNVLNSQNSMLNATDVANNPYVTGMMDMNASHVMRNLNESVLPSIDSRYGAAGHVGGSSQSAIERGLATGRASDAIADSNTRIMANAYGAGLAAQNSALANSGNIAQMGLMPSQIYSNVGNDQYNLPWQNMSNAMNLLVAPGGGSQTTPTYGPSTFSQLAGTGLTLYGLSQGVPA
ncbi:MAG: hypothetical protein AAF434_17190 [Pseudomonadota bacterium]